MAFCNSGDFCCNFEDFFFATSAYFILQKTYERYGAGENGLRLLYFLTLLPQTEATLERVWQIEDTNYNITFKIDTIIAAADLGLLKKMPHVRPRAKWAKNRLEQRLELAALSTDELWQRLWRYSKKQQGKYVDGFDFGYGRLIINELAGRPDFPRGLYQEKLVADYPEDYDGWDDTYLCALAGALRDEAAIPFLVGSLKMDADFLLEEAVEALSRIGSGKVVEALGAEFANGDPDFRMYAAEALGRLRLPAAEEMLLELGPKEPDITVKTFIALGLGKMLSARGIPFVRELIETEYDYMITDLVEPIYAMHVVNGIDCPELAGWQKHVFEEEERLARAARRLEGLAGSKLDEDGAEAQAISSGSAPAVKAPKVGRNDPCPCGSGKKYKKCCGR